MDKDLLKGLAMVVGAVAVVAVLFVVGSNSGPQKSQMHRPRPEIGRGLREYRQDLQADQALVLNAYLNFSLLSRPAR